jgi:predicted amidohydrolase YtcJ
MLADIAVFDRDLTTLPLDQIRNASVRFTFVGGEMVYAK